MTLFFKSAIVSAMDFYILQVETGHEAGFIEKVKKLSPELSQKHNLIYLTRELTIRRQGKWLKEQQPVFPGYVIMQTTSSIDSKTLLAFKAVPGFYHFLKSNTEITPLAGNDLFIIHHFLGLGPKIGSSLVKFDENDRIVVVEGPLKGIEGNIIKVDRRKQRAKIRVDFGGSSHTMDLSFEDISKR